MATIVVGIEDSFRAQDAVALAGEFARAAGADVLAVCAFPFDDAPAAHYNPTIRDDLRANAARTLDRLCEPLSDIPLVRQAAVADPSPARALMNAAARAGAELIVVGSSHGEFTGRVTPGSTGRRLLQGAPCAVALTPQGHRMRPHGPWQRITAGFDGSRGAHAALATAGVIARATGASLRVVSVFTGDQPRIPISPGFARMTLEAEDEARAAVERAVASIRGAQAAFVGGDPACELARESEVSDLLVIGPRGYGPEDVVVLGGVGEVVMRSAACPAMVVPNGVAEPVRGLFGRCGKLLMDSAV